MQHARNKNRAHKMLSWVAIACLGGFLAAPIYSLQGGERPIDPCCEKKLNPFRCVNHCCSEVTPCSQTSGQGCACVAH